jgi:hypothetical protein
MPRHAKNEMEEHKKAPKSIAGSKVADPDYNRPVMDNVPGYSRARMASKSVVDASGIHPSHGNIQHAKGGVAHPGKSVSSGMQQATALPAALGIINPHEMTKPRHMGIPGIIETTTEGAMTRARLVGGIIESPMSDGRAASGPVHDVMGHDATAYNAGMRHLPGSPFSSRH